MKEVLNNTNPYSEIMLSAIKLQIAVLNREGEIVAINKAWEEYASEEGKCTGFASIVGTNYLTMCQIAIDQGLTMATELQKGITAILEGYETEFSIEYTSPFYPPEEAPFFRVEAKKYSDEFEGVILSREVITERVRERQKLIESESNATTLFDYSPILIWEEDFSAIKQHLKLLAASGVTDYRAYFDEHPEEVAELASKIKVTQVNKKSMEFYNVTTVEELNTNIGDWFLEDSLEVFKEELIVLAHGGTKFESEISVITPQGEIKYLFIAVSVPPQYMETFEKIMVSFVDVTEMRETKKKLADTMKAQVDSIMVGQENERARIAAELHDSINPLLTLARLNIDAITPYYNKNKKLPQDQLCNISNLLDSAMLGIKEISSNLSPTILKDFGLSNALQHLCDKINQSTQLSVNYQSHGFEERCELKVEIALYRISQELLNNILKHAHASKLEVQLVRHRESIVLMVSDNGVGFDTTAILTNGKGHGLKNIISRVEAIDGTLNIDSAIGKGTTIIVELSI